MEDSKKRDEDMFTNFFVDFVSASDKRNADLTSKLMEGFGNILKDIRKLKLYFLSKVICKGLK